MRYMEAVRAQGENLRSSGAAVADQLKGLDLTRWQGRRLGLVGMGASANAIGTVLPSYWAAGLSATAWLGSELGYPGAADNFDAVIAVSQSGQSTEIVTALAGPASSYPRLVVTDRPDSPAGRLADATLGLALVGDSNVRTMGYTGTLQALFRLADALAGPDGRPSADWGGLAGEVDRQLPAAERLAAARLGALAGVRSFDVVGGGGQAGTAAQGALLLREVAKRPAAAYETYQYLHGPIEAAGPGLGLLIIGGAREARLAASLAGAGAEILLITGLDDEELATAGLAVGGQAMAGLATGGQATAGLAAGGSAGAGGAAGPAVFRVPGRDDAALGVLGLLPLQTISGALAEAAGLPDGEFLFHQDDTKVGR